MFLIDLALNNYSNAVSKTKLPEPKSDDNLNIILYEKCCAIQAKNNELKIQDAKAHLNELESEVIKINASVERLKNNESFDIIQSDLIKIESSINELRTKQKAIRYEIKQIDSLPKPENISENEISILFNQFKKGLGDMVEKSLIEVKLNLTRFRSTVGMMGAGVYLLLSRHMMLASSSAWPAAHDMALHLLDLMQHSSPPSSGLLLTSPCMCRPPWRCRLPLQAWTPPIMSLTTILPNSGPPPPPPSPSPSWPPSASSSTAGFS